MQKTNKISVLTESILELTKLENLRLGGNTIAISNTGLAVLFGSNEVKTALESYFEKSKDSSGSSKPGFLNSGSNLNDVVYLRKKIADLQMEITDLKSSSLTVGKKSLEEQKDWMHTGARPTTASSQVKKIRDLEDDLKIERNNNKKLLNEVGMLKSEIKKASILSSASGEEGTIGQVPGVMEIEYDELDLGDQIGQGGFSVIKQGVWRSTDVAIKIIFDPVITEDLLAEVRNEVQMLSILRHPKIVMLMGMSSKPPNLAIVFEYLPKG